MIQFPGIKAAIACVSSRPGLGKTTVLAHLATALAHGEAAVTVLDCGIAGSSIEARLPVTPPVKYVRLAAPRDACEIAFGRLQYLLLDLPAGDPQWLGSMSRELALTGALVVSSSDPADAQLSGSMVKNLELPMLGVIESRKTGEGTDLSDYCRSMELPFLGAVAEASSLSHVQPCVAAESYALVRKTLHNLLNEVQMLKFSQSLRKRPN